MLCVHVRDDQMLCMCCTVHSPCPPTRVQWQAGAASVCGELGAHGAAVPVCSVPVGGLQSGGYHSLGPLPAEVRGGVTLRASLTDIFQRMLLHPLLIGAWLCAAHTALTLCRCCTCVGAGNLLVSSPCPAIDIRYQTLEASPPADITSVALSVDERCVVAGLANGSVILYALCLPDY
jgi:hypothetical protein